MLLAALGDGGTDAFGLGSRGRLGVVGKILYVERVQLLEGTRRGGGAEVPDRPCRFFWRGTNNYVQDWLTFEGKCR